MDIETAIKALESNSGYDRNTENWKAIRALVEHAKRESVWFIAVIERDQDNRWSTRPLWDRGFYVTEDEAWKQIAKMQDSHVDFTTYEVDRAYHPV